MPEELEGTTQVQPDETTPEAEASAPEVAVPEVGASEPVAEASQPEITREQIMAHPQFQEMQSELQRREEARAAAVASADERSRQVQALTGQVAAQADPVESARQRWEESKINYEIDETQAFDAYMDARESRASSRNQQAARNDMYLEQQLQVARPYGIESREEMTRLAGQITAEDLGIIKLHKAGKLAEFMDQQKRQANLRADAASLAASGMTSRATGGAGGADPDFAHVGATTFISWAPHKQESYLKEHGLPPGVEAHDQ